MNMKDEVVKHAMAQILEREEMRAEIKQLRDLLYVSKKHPDMDAITLLMQQDKQRAEEIRLLNKRLRKLEQR